MRLAVFSFGAKILICERSGNEKRKKEYYIARDTASAAPSNEEQRTVNMATFFNQATFKLGSTVTNSNITEGEILSGVEITKTALSRSYSQGGSIFYAIAVSNLTAGALENVSLSDDLGAYIPVGATEAVVPLDYVSGSLLYYQNGVLQPTPTVSAGPPLTVSGLTIPQGSYSLFIYEASVNGTAPLEAGSCITNTVTATECGLEANEGSSARVCIEESTNLSIAKSICPPLVGACGTVSYTFIIQNTGNVAVAATDNAILADSFSPPLSGISVTLDGAPLTEGVGYEYDEASGAFTTLNGAISVPAATYVRDPVSGVITVTPGVTVLTVTGKIGA